MPQDPPTSETDAVCQRAKRTRRLRRRVAFAVACLGSLCLLVVWLSRPQPLPELAEVLPQSGNMTLVEAGAGILDEALEELLPALLNGYQTDLGAVPDWLAGNEQLASSLALRTRPWRAAVHSAEDQMLAVFCTGGWRRVGAWATATPQYRRVQWGGRVFELAVVESTLVVGTNRDAVRQVIGRMARAGRSMVAPGVVHWSARRVSGAGWQRSVLRGLPTPTKFEAFEGALRAGSGHDSWHWDYRIRSEGQVTSEQLDSWRAWLEREGVSVAEEADVRNQAEEPLPGFGAHHQNERWDQVGRWQLEGLRQAVRRAAADLRFWTEFGTGSVSGEDHPRTRK